MKRFLFREQVKESNNPRYLSLKVGVVGIGRQSGVTSVGTTIARLVSRAKDELVQYVEMRDLNCKKPLIYHTYGMDMRFLGREFTDFYKETAEENSVKTKVNREEGIGWVLMTEDFKRYNRNLTLIEKLHLLHNIDSGFIVADFDVNSFQELNTLLKEMSKIIVVIDPAPSKLIFGKDLLDYLKSLEGKGTPLYYILNKMNEGVNKRELFDFLKVKPDLTIPLIDQKEFYGIEYAMTFPDSIEPFKTPIHEFLKNIKMV